VKTSGKGPTRRENAGRIIRFPGRGILNALRSVKTDRLEIAGGAAVSDRTALCACLKMIEERINYRSRSEFPDTGRLGAAGRSTGRRTAARGTPSDWNAENSSMISTDSGRSTANVGPPGGSRVIDFEASQAQRWVVESVRQRASGR